MASWTWETCQVFEFSQPAFSFMMVSKAMPDIPRSYASISETSINSMKTTRSTVKRSIPTAGNSGFGNSKGGVPPRFLRKIIIPPQGMTGEHQHQWFREGGPRKKKRAIPRVDEKILLSSGDFLRFPHIKNHAPWLPRIFGSSHFSAAEKTLKEKQALDNHEWPWKHQ